MDGVLDEGGCPVRDGEYRAFYGGPACVDLADDFEVTPFGQNFPVVEGDVTGEDHVPLILPHNSFSRSRSSVNMHPVAASAASYFAKWWAQNVRSPASRWAATYARALHRSHRSCAVSTYGGLFVR